MAQAESSRTAQRLAEDAGDRRVDEAGYSSRRREWAPKAAALGALAAGGILANTLPAVELAPSESLALSEVADRLTRTGDGWVLTLTWLAAILAAVSTVVFPRGERFVQTLAISFGAVVAFVLPWFVAGHLTQIDREATSIGGGLIGFTAAFGVAAILPWLSLLWWNRTRPVLGRDWVKWVFVLPAAVWILFVTVFPLAFAITTSRYAFRTGRIAREVGWDNYKELFAIEVPARTVGIALILLAGTAAAVLAIGLAWRWLQDRTVRRQDVHDAAGLIPVLAVPVTLVYVAGRILSDPLGTQFKYTVIFVAAAVSVEMVLGFLLALLLDRELRGRAVLRTVFILPIFATPVAVGYLGRTIFYEAGGPVNSVLTTFGIDPPGWLSDPNWAKVTTVIGDVWQWTPFVFIIALAGLQALPRDVVEASEVDGANPWQNLRYVILPMMAPILWLILLLRTIDAFKVVDLIFALTLGGPGRATEYYSMYNYRTAWRDFRYGDAAAQGFLLLFIVMILVSLLWGRIRHLYEEDQEGRA